MKKKFKNAEMDVMINQLKPVLSHRDKIGYIAARNYRILAECLTEYEAFRNASLKSTVRRPRTATGGPLSALK